jgi:hypothetical protein
VRFEFYLLAAFLGLTLAVVVPEARTHGLRGALLVLAGSAGVLGAGFALLAGATWMLEETGRPDTAGSAARAWVGGLLRFGLCGCIAALVCGSLVAWHGLSLAAENGVTLGAGAVGGAAGVLLHLRLGPERYWTAFGRLAIALLASLLFGLLGILGPGNWGVDLGILAPLGVFVLLAAAGRIVPPPAGT